MLKWINDYMSLFKTTSSLSTENEFFEKNPFQWKEVDPSSKGEKKTLYGMCRMCMQGDCLTLVHLVDDIVVRVEGNPGAPPNYGSLCPRGNSVILNLYNPYRVKAPLMRTNPERGLDVDPKWKEISWDEALDTVADRFKKIREKDPRGLVVCEGWGIRETYVRVPFVHAFGTPNEIGSHGALCTVHYGTALVHANFPISVVDLEYCQYHITMGRSVGPNFATSGGTRKFSKAIDRGMKLIVVDPRSSHEASKGEWVPIRPGTDLAFLLAMAHVMLYEIGKYDEWFLKNRTNAPYLIDFEGNYLRDEQTGKPLMWDSVDGVAKPIHENFKDIALIGTYNVNGVMYQTGFDMIRQQHKQYTPEWAEKITTISADTIRRIAREFVEHAQIGSTIEIDGFVFPYRPVSLNNERNSHNHRGGTYADLEGKIINMLVGAIEVPGSCLGCGKRGPVLAPGEDGTVLPAYEAVGIPFEFPPQHIDLAEFYPNKHTGPHTTVKAILEPEKYHITYPIEAWLTVGGNPIRTNAEPEVFVEAYKKVPFQVSVAYHMDEPTFLADIILPEHSFLERLRVTIFWPSHQSVSAETNGLQMVSVRQPVPALFNTKHVDEILLELADRIGILRGEDGVNHLLNVMEDYIIEEQGLRLLGPYKLDVNQKYSFEDLYDRYAKSWLGDEKGIDYLNKVGYEARWQSQKMGYNYYYFPDNKTRHEFYFINLKKQGEELKANLRKHNITFPGVADEDYVFELYKPIPFWVENSEFTTDSDYDLWAFNWKTPYYSSDVGNVTGNPWLAEIYKKDPYEAVVCMNTDTAKKKGLTDGELVVVESRYGKVEGQLRVSELFHPETAGISGCYGLGTLHSNPLNRKGPNFNTLVPIGDKTYDAVSAGVELSPKVKVYRKEGAR